MDFQEEYKKFNIPKAIIDEQKKDGSKLPFKKFTKLKNINIKYSDNSGTLIYPDNS